MCGIAGILRIHPPGTFVPQPLDAIPPRWLDILDESIAHRGPDDEGCLRDRAMRPDGATVDVALLHRRLAIIDPDDGHQPMCIELPGPSAATDEPPVWRLAVIFNGCIYNHRELRSSLESAGHRFQTDHSDTEVWLHGWHGHGINFWRDLRDWMGALALWDSRSGSLFLARDRFGEKPLYVFSTHGGRTWAFASTAAALLRLKVELDGPLEIDPLGLGDWIRYGCHPELSPIRGITQVPAASAVCIPGASGDPMGAPQRLPPLAVEPGDEDLANLEGEAIASRIESLLGEAVARRLDADVPLGCFLSGGVDSSLVALAASRRVKHLTTICVRMPDPRYDESAHAARIAETIGSHHVTIDADASPAGDLVRLIESLGLPFGDSSLLPTWWAARAASRHLKVVLTGDGADELFLGYERQSALRLLALARPAGALLGRSFLLPRGHPKSRRDKLARLLVAARYAGYADLVSIFPTPDWRDITEGSNPSLQTSDADAHTILEARRVDIERHLAADMLRKVDTATMAAGVEARAPFLAPSVAAAALTLSPRQLMPRGQRKGLLRMVARRHLPADIIDRPKMGFAIPIGEWFRSDYGGMRSLLLDHLESSNPWGSALNMPFNKSVIKTLIQQHMTGRTDHGQRLYMLLVLSIWARSLSSR